MTFDIPVKLCDGRKLWTLAEARAYVAKLPAAERASERWQNASRQLDLCELHGTVWKFIAPVSVSRAVHGIEPYAIDRPDDATGLNKKERAALAYKQARAAYKARKEAND